VLEHSAAGATVKTFQHDALTNANAVIDFRLLRRRHRLVTRRCRL
jgi:hypothetical protein